MTETDNILEILLRLVRGERSTYTQTPSVISTPSVSGPLLAALLLGIADVMGKYYVPKLGAFIVYTVMIVILMLRPQGLFGRSATR